MYRFVIHSLWPQLPIVAIVHKSELIGTEEMKSILVPKHSLMVIMSRGHFVSDDILWFLPLPNLNLPQKLPVRKVLFVWWVVIVIRRGGSRSAARESGTQSALRTGVRVGQTKPVHSALNLGTLDTQVTIS